MENNFEFNKLVLLRKPLKKTTSLTATCSYLVMTMAQSFAMDSGLKESDHSLKHSTNEAPASSAATVKIQEGAGEKSAGALLKAEGATYGLDSDNSDSDNEAYYTLSPEDITLSNHHAQELDPIEYALSIIQGRLEYNQNLINQLRDDTIPLEDKYIKFLELAGVSKQFTSALTGKPDASVLEQISGYLENRLYFFNDVMTNYGEPKKLIEKIKHLDLSERNDDVERLYLAILPVTFLKG